MQSGWNEKRYSTNRFFNHITIHPGKLGKLVLNIQYYIHWLRSLPNPAKEEMYAIWPHKGLNCRVYIYAQTKNIRTVSQFPRWPAQHANNKSHFKIILTFWRYTVVYIVNKKKNSMHKGFNFQRIILISPNH